MKTKIVIIVISGLQPSDQHNDDHLVHQLLFEFWKIPLTSTITTKRLGRDLKNGRVQPVLVNLPDETTANTILDNALVLRKSPDATIRSTVFVNRDLTKGERLAAFELRQKQRKSNEQCSKPVSTSPPQISNSVGAKPVSSSALSPIPGPSRLAATAPLVSPVQPPIPLSSDTALPSVKAWLDDLPSSSSSIPAYLFNARSLRNKLPKLHHLIYSSDPSLYFITETWLTEDVTDRLLDPNDHFNIIRHDRQGRIGGGVCALVPKQFRYSTIDIDRDDLLTSGCEIICFVIHNINKIRYKFTLVYKPRNRLNSIIEQSRATALAQTLHKHCDVDTHGIVLGDFNLPGIDWLANSFKSDGIHNVLYDCFSTLGLSQFVNNYV